MKQTTKPNLVLDFDETLFSTGELTVEFLNHYFDIRIRDTEYVCGHSLHELVIQNFSQTHTLMSREEFYEILGREFLASQKWHEGVVPIPGVLEILPELAERYTLHIATARQDSSGPVVEMLLDKFLPGIISSTHFVWKHLGSRQFQGVPKIDFIRGLPKVMGYVDDNPKETLPVCGLIPQVVLFDPHEHHLVTECTSHRVSHWNEIAKVFL